MVDSRLSDLRKSMCSSLPIAGLPSPNDMTPNAATGYSTAGKRRRMGDLARDLRRLGVRD